MIEKWTGRLIGKMHNEKIRLEDLAAELGYTKSYVSMILNGKRNPPGARSKFEAAVASIIANRPDAQTPKPEQEV